MSKHPIPEGYNTITPTLIVEGAAEAIKLYEKAFGAKEVYRMNTPDGSKIMHACLQIGSSRLFLCDVNPQMSTASNSSFYLYMEDVDATFRQAKQAGLEETSAVQDMFWGDRTGSIKDKFGIRWTIASHVRDVSKDELEKAAKQWGTKAA